MWLVYLCRNFITTTLLLFFQQVLLQECYGCLQEERMALLELKAYWYNNNPNANFDGALASWNSKDKDSECCDWERVGCDNTMGRVTKLDLSDYTWEFYKEGQYPKPLYLNASLFLSFQELHTLDLSRNNLYGTIKGEGFERLSVLTNLATLYLSYNSFNDSILPSVSTLSSLTTLFLNFNYQIGTWNEEGLCRLKKLEVLVLNNNNLEGTLPSSLGNLTSLTDLDLSNNRFVGNVASSPLVNLVSLEHLDLSRNKFKSLSPFSSFANHSKLLSFELSSGTDELQVETEYPTNWIPTFQLERFTLSNCTFINIPLGVIPNFLYHQMGLITLQISFTNLQGEFPSWLLRKNTSLQDIYLNDNSLIGSPFDLPPSSQHSKDLVSLVLSNNHIHGHLPTNIRTSFPNLKTLDLSNNYFHGEIPSSIGNMSLLSNLNLSNNNLSGEIPENLARGCTSLAFLALSNNQLHGQISPLIFNMTSLENLYLDSNHFTGLNIPQSLSLSLPSINGSNDLRVLDVRDNIMSELPNRLGNMMMLTELYMSKNHIRGPLPEALCSLERLEILDLSNNNITGHIPPCFNPPFIRFVNLRRNGLTGSFMNYDNNVFTQNRSELVALDLGDNNISGGISSNINGSFLQLHILILKGNHLRGLIPKQLCHLYQISMMDLSFNYLSGPIPSCLANLTFKLTEDALALNDLSIPAFYMQSPNEESVEFTTKKRKETYQGGRLRYVSGIDLSSNQLTGSIPHEIGKIGQIHALNLSHNRLTGTIPSTFSKLDSIESLDLSYNNLRGSIPLELVQLTSLAVFSVAHNNLTGKTPAMKAQFATFDESSYVGNPFLCGLPLNKSCSVTSATEEEEEEEEDSSSINFVVFFGSFTASYVMGFIGVIVVLYINPYWRRVWFHMVDEWICSIDYFLLVMYYKLKHFVRA